MGGGEAGLHRLLFQVHRGVEYPGMRPVQAETETLSIASNYSISVHHALVVVRRSQGLVAVEPHHRVDQLP